MSKRTERPTTDSMKKVMAALALSLLIISACIFYLLRTGISLRPAPLIMPSVMSEDQSHVASAIVHRLFQEFQDSHYVLWGVLPETEDSVRILNLAVQEYEKTFHLSVNFIRDAETASEEYLRACKKPCWLLISNKKANQLDLKPEAGSFIESHLRPLNLPFFTLTFIPFQKNTVVTDECNNQKRLSLDCLVSVSVREAIRKMKDPSKRYFFMNKYNEIDYFLFLQHTI